MRLSATWKTCLAAVLALSPLINAANFTNPLREFEGSDPHIVTWDGYYYLMTTTFRDLQITRAKTLEGLKTGERVTVFTDTTEGRSCNIWAPELHYLDGTWYIYYTASGCANLDDLRPHVLKGKLSERLPTSQLTRNRRSQSIRYLHVRECHDFRMGT